MYGIGLLVILGLSNAVSSIWIGAFNIKDFGVTKLGKTLTVGTVTYNVKTVLFDIIKLYDILLIQEIQMPDPTTSKDVFGSFVTELNHYVGNGNKNAPNFAYKISPYLGPGLNNNGKEKYAYIYNSKTIQLDAQVFPENANNINFDRPPYIAQVRDKTGGLQVFYLVGLHARPTNCIYEMINLQKVYDWLRNNLETSYDRVIFLGDFNAGGSYFKVGVDEYKVPFLYHNPAIRQYITGNTNIKNDEPYDKIAVSSCIFRKDYLNEPQVFDFKTKLYPKQLPDELVEMVSDHFPTAMELIANTGSRSPSPDGCVGP